MTASMVGVKILHLDDKGKIVSDFMQRGLFGSRSRCVWKVGKTKKLPWLQRNERVECCENGYHMSPTLRLATDIMGSRFPVVAVVQGDGRYDSEGGKTAHEAMTVMHAWNVKGSLPVIVLECGDMNADELTAYMDKAGHPRL